MENKRLLFLNSQVAKRHPVISSYIERVMKEENIHCFKHALYEEQKKYLNKANFTCPFLNEEHIKLQEEIRRTA